MRIGMNPQKAEKKVELVTNHRVVVVVFIPEMSGFYKNSFEVFKLCINSLTTSTNKKIAITVVNNGSCNEVVNFLDMCLKNGDVDTVIHHSKNIGKIDAMIGAARGAREQLITLTDSDILFKSGWQYNVENIFKTFKNVGIVSPIPVRQSKFYATSTTLLKILFKNIKLSKKAIPENFDDHNKYMQSINWDLETDKNALWSVLEYNNCKAILGAGHQVLTLNRDILFKTVPTNPSLTLVGNSSEYNYVDIPVDKSSGLRLSTYNNYAYHMGNTPEEWMYEVVSDNKLQDFNDQPELNFKNSDDLFNSQLAFKWYRFKSRIIKKLFKIFYK